MNVSANSRELVESDDDLLDAELRKSISSTIYATLCQVDIYTISTQDLHNIYTLCQGDSNNNTPERTRRNWNRDKTEKQGYNHNGFSFSPVESVDSSFSLGKD